eukprot:3333076-Amphidinium_carterae.1
MVGHIAVQCKSQGVGASAGSAHGKGSRPSTYFTQAFVQQHADTFTTLTLPAETVETKVMGLLDTGAVNAVAGAQVMLSLDAALRTQGLGLVEIPPTTKISGVGGLCETVVAVQAPISLGQKCGCLAVAVCKARIPLLLPLPLLEALGAQI